jgi:23S rRNA (pseudouridine1915-N3)-methyltransferase
MHRITLLCIGSLKAGWVRGACEEYSARLRSHVRLTIVELPTSRERIPERQRSEESQRLLRALDRVEGRVVILDERGARTTSPQFSKILAEARDAGTPMTFVLGGAYGFSDAVREAGETVRMSDLTLPHELARILFLEQLYGACEIGRGSGYHH